MKTKYLKFIPLLLSSLVITACGYSLRELYSGDAYNDSNFAKNFYEVKESSFANVRESKKITLSEDEIFEHFEDDNFNTIVGKDKYAYEDEKIGIDIGNKQYLGSAIKMSSIDDTFNYGIISKLFDGQMFCDNNYQLSRVQINEKGFSFKTKKEGSNFNYFLLNLKGAVLFNDKEVSYETKESFIMKTEIKIKMYEKTNNGLSCVEFSSIINPRANNISFNTEYTCFGFSLKNHSLDRVVGFDISYSLIELDKISDGGILTPVSTDGYLHSLFLYELSLPNSSWN